MTEYMDEDMLGKELDTIDDIRIRLQEIAQESGSVSKDEQSILDAIENDLHELENLIRSNYQKEDVATRIKEKKKEIFSHARKIAGADGQYREDEWRLLELISEYSDT